jgi:hypothetical protein
MGRERQSRRSIMSAKAQRFGLCKHVDICILDSIVLFKSPWYGQYQAGLHMHTRAIASSSLCTKWHYSGLCVDHQELVICTTVSQYEQ